MLLPASLLLFLVHYSNGLNCSRLLTENTPGQILPNGTLLAGDFLYETDHFESVNSSHFRVCICSVQRCLRKCCPVGQIYEANVCVASDVEFSPRLYDDDLDIVEENATKGMYLIHGVTCPSYSVLTNHVGVHWNRTYPLLDGNLQLPSYSYADHHLFTPDEFCLEYHKYSDGKVYGPTPLICYPPAAASTYPVAFTVGMWISIASLTVTFMVYALLPDLRNLHGKSLMCHIAAFTTGFLALAISRISSSSRSYGLCFALGFVVAFSSLSAFFWLSAMSFDIWWTFSVREKQQGDFGLTQYFLPKSEELNKFGFYKKAFLGSIKKTFIVYSIYAWGVPMIILILTIVMDKLPNHLFPSFLVRPKFATGRCWYNGQVSKLTYFFGPIGILIFCNIAFFTITSINLMKARKQTSGLRRKRGGDAKSNAENRQRFGLYLKLFLIMGLNWTMEVIGQIWSIPYKIWFAFNLFNTLQGVFIFLIFVCKTRIKDQLLAKFSSKKRKELKTSKKWQKMTARQVASSDSPPTSSMWKPSTET